MRRMGTVSRIRLITVPLCVVATGLSLWLGWTLFHYLAWFFGGSDDFGTPLFVHLAVGLAHSFALIGSILFALASAISSKHLTRAKRFSLVSRLGVTAVLCGFVIALALWLYPFATGDPNAYGLFQIDLSVWAYPLVLATGALITSVIVRSRPDEEPLARAWSTLPMTQNGNSDA